jgi:enoyl-CoA hydratase/carnithine racemase/predicted thioesterase
MRTTPQIGEAATYRMAVNSSRTISLGRGGLSVEVCSTPSMILAMELAARKLLLPHLEENEESVGVSVDIEHLAPTPKGETVEARATLVRAEKGQFEFEVSARDANKQIGRGTHQRAVVKMDKFLAALPAGHTSRVEPTDPTERFGQTITLSIEGPVATLRLNRPASLNAINAAMTGELEACMEKLEASHPAVRVCLLEGAGRGFCAGEDIKENASLDADASLELARRRSKVCDRLARLPQVVIAKVQGPCMGGGMALAVHCDLIGASHNARFAMPEIKLGWPPPYSLDLLVERIGRFKALELVLSGRTFTAREALDLDLLWKVLPASRLHAEVDRFIHELCRLSPAALLATKKLIRGYGSQEQSAFHEAQLGAYGRCRDTEAARSGIRAFMEP